MNQSLTLEKFILVKLNYLRFKKNLKALYVVHPTMLFKVLWQVIRPLISSKFNKKVTYCNTLAELGAHIDLNILKIHPEIKMYSALEHFRYTKF